MGEAGFASALATAQPEEFLRVEREAGLEASFARLDILTANLMLMALSGRELVSITPAGPRRGSGETVSMTFLTSQDRAFVDERFSLGGQQRKGAWFLPEEARLKAGSLNLPARHHPEQAITLSWGDSARTKLASTADALLVWSLLIPLFDTLMAPIVLRAAGSDQPADDQRRTWTTVLDSYSALGIPHTPEVTLFAYGGGWARLDRAGQVRARIALLDALTRHDLLSVAARFRALRLRTLFSAIVAKSRAATPLARRVLTRAVQPTLSAYFAGDWLACLEYLSMPPNPGEELVTALPTPKLYVGGVANASAAAAEHGVEADEVEAMLAAFLNQSTAVSPVEQRVTVLRRWWEESDAIHARQQPGMNPLWGLVEETSYAIGYGQGPDHRLYRTSFTSDLVREIDLLWDGATLPRWPQAIVSEPYPHRLMADTFGCHTEQFFVRLPAKRRVQGIDELVRGDRQQIDPTWCGRGLLADREVQAGQVAVEPMVRGFGRDAGKAVEGGRHFPLADEYRQKARLAAAGVTYLQIAEALGRWPEPKEFGINRFEWSWAGGPDQGWPIYQTAVAAVLREPADRQGSLG